MNTLFDSFFGFFFFLFDLLLDFKNAVQWLLSNISTIFSAFFSLLSFVRSGFSFFTSLIGLVPSILLPFLIALFIYWLVMFIIKIGG